MCRIGVFYNNRFFSFLHVVSTFNLLCRLQSINAGRINFGKQMITKCQLQYDNVISFTLDFFLLLRKKNKVNNLLFFISLNPPFPKISTFQPFFVALYNLSREKLLDF